MLVYIHSIKPAQMSLNTCFCVSDHRLPDSIFKKHPCSLCKKVTVFTVVLVSSAPKFRGIPYNSRSHSDIEEGGV